MAERLAQAARGYVPPKRVLLPELGERYHAHARLHKRSWPRDQQLWKRLLESFGPVRLTEVGPLKLEDYQQKRAKEVAPATVNRELALLKHVYNLARRWQLFEGTNPVSLVKPLREENLRLRVLNEAEEKGFLASAPPCPQDLVVFACNTGLRSGDIFKLK